MSGPKEERRERVLWARFEVGDMNDLSMPHLSESAAVGGESSRHGPLPLLLILGLCNGYSIWMITVSGHYLEIGDWALIREKHSLTVGILGKYDGLKLLSS